MARARIDPAIRYHAKVDKRGPDECWPWTASCFKSGYGQFYDGETNVTAHSFGYKLLVGPLPDKHGALHTCDNPPCQNPAHWYAGTQAQNAADRERRGRGNHPCGTQNGQARLTEADALDIIARYAAGEHAQAIADHYGIAQTHVNHIAHGKKWSHLPRPVVTRNRNKITDDQVREIRRLYAAGIRQRVIAERFDTTVPNVSHIVRRRYRTDVVD